MSYIDSVVHWLLAHYIEVIATLAGFLYIYYTIRENTLLWLYGNISSALFAWVFFQSHIYAYSVLYVFYVVIGFYGWYNWWKHSHAAEEPLLIRKSSKQVLIACIVVSLGFTLPVYLVLQRLHESDVALLDALLTSAGMVATWMLTQKLIEQWIFWIVIDILSLGLVFFKGLYPSSLLFAAYTLLAVKGYFEWKKQLKETVIP
jgi:nicotinamide mononucleotide transporter